MVAKLLGGKTYTYPTVTPIRGKEKVKTKEKEVYLFNISKADKIFDFLFKGKQIKFLKGTSSLQLTKLKKKKNQILQVA